MSIKEEPNIIIESIGTDTAVRTEQEMASLQKSRANHLILAIIVTNFVAFMNSATVNLALTTFIRLFHVTVNTVQWVAIIYLLPLAMMMPLAGYLSGRYSYRKVIRTGLVIMFIGALGCTLSQSFSMLLFFRFLKGIAGGMVVPCCVGMIYRYIPTNDRSRYLGYMMLAQSVGMALGPTISGFILEFFSWRALFGMNVPMILLAIWAARGGIPEEAGRKEGNIDYFGILQVSGGTAVFMYAFTMSETWGWTSPLFLGLAGGSVLMLIWFVIRQLHTKYPLLNFSVLQYPAFVLMLCIVGLLSMAKGVNAMLAQYYLQAGRGFSPLIAGLILLPASVATVAGSFSANVLHAKGYVKSLVVIGLAMALTGVCGMCSLGIESSVLFIEGCYILRYFGMQLMNMPTTNYGMAVIPKDLSGHASSMFSWSCQIVQLVSTNVMTVLLSLHLGRYYANMGGVGAPLEGTDLYREAIVKAVNMDYRYIAVMTGIVLILSSVFMKGGTGKPTGKDD